MTNDDLSKLRRLNNPHNEPTGHYTGRCWRCGSKDLWDDNLAYGCNCCGALLAGNGYGGVVASRHGWSDDE